MIKIISKLTTIFCSLLEFESVDRSKFCINLARWLFIQKCTSVTNASLELPNKMHSIFMITFFHY